MQNLRPKDGSRLHECVNGNTLKDAHKKIVIVKKIKFQYNIKFVKWPTV